MFLNEYTASVDWGTNTPGRVDFYVNGALRQSVPTTAFEAKANIDMAFGFFGTLTTGANRIEAVAVSADGTPSDPFTQPVTVIPVPSTLDLFAWPFELIPDNDPYYKFHIEIPPRFRPASAQMPIPWFGRVGLNLSGVGDLKYHILSGQWEVSAGLNLSPPKLSWGDWNAGFAFSAQGQGVASQTRGFDVDEVGLKLGLDAEYPILKVYVFDLVPGGQVLHVLDTLVLVGVDLNSVQRLRVDGLFRLDADLLWSYHGLNFREARITPVGGLKALYAPHLLGSSVQLDVTGELSFPWRLNPPMSWEVDGEVSLGCEVKLWGLVLFETRWVLLSGRLASSGAAASLPKTMLRVLGPDGTPIMIEGTVITLTSACPRPADRDYLKQGGERFVGGAVGKTANIGEQPPLTDFRLLSQRGAKASAVTSSSTGMKDLQPGPFGTPQADLTLVENIFPSSQPALASRSNELMLLYVADNGSSNALQCTDIHWTRWDGTNWSAPQPIQTNTQAEFEPQVAYDGNGDAIAVWERVADPNFNQTNVSAMAAQMEIVWSKWSRASYTWSTPAALTANNVLDHAPLVCGPMSDGSMLALWTRNEANLLMGTNGAGSSVLWAQWNPVSQTWSTPLTLLADLPYRLSQSLAGARDRAVYAWTRDLQGALTNDSGQQVFYCQWQGNTWGPPTQFTTNSTGNHNVRVAVTAVPILIPTNTVEGFESGGFLSLPWSFTGNAPWSVENSVVRSGSFAAQAGTIGWDQTSGMTVTLDCSTGQVAFAWKTSTDPGWEGLAFTVDNQSPHYFDGETPWTTASVPVSAGRHTFKWEAYSSHSIWVDDIVFPTVTTGFVSSVYLVWQQGTNLVLNTNFSPSNSVVRPDSQTAGFADYAMTLGPQGNLAILWQETSQDGADPYYVVYDPVSATWSKDARLLQDAPLERAFALVWDDLGNLTVAYDKVQVLYTNQTLILNNQTITITNVPQFGRVDLAVTKRALVKDLALGAGDFSASGTNYLPGASVTLTAAVRNTGNLAMSNVVVAFWDGNPTNSGTLITNVTLPGWLEGGATNVAFARWTVPGPATNHTLCAVVNPSGLASENNTTNNTQSLRVGDTDLAVGLVSYRAETNGAVRVIAQVKNLGAPSATNSVLAIRFAGQTNTPLATASVPLLEPGRLAQVVLDLPPGTQPAGEATYRLFVDETHVVPDVDTNNNTTAFSVNLWIDSDADGIPDNWMMQYFDHPTGLTSDNSRAQDSASGDGISNLQKYLTGKNPLIWDNLHFVSVQFLTNRTCKITLFGQVGHNYSLLASTNLVAWTPILSFPCTNATMAVLDANAQSYAAKFYRLVTPPAVPAISLNVGAGRQPNTNGLDLVLHATAGLEYRIDASADLFNWTAITNFISTNATTLVHDTTATNFLRRFYRAVAP